jgi:hypothetical protein
MDKKSKGVSKKGVTNRGKLVGIEVRVFAEVPTLEAAAAVNTMFSAAAQAVAHAGWGGGAFEATLVYDGKGETATDTETTEAPAASAHDSRLN